VPIPFLGEIGIEVFSQEFVETQKLQITISNKTLLVEKDKYEFSPSSKYKYKYQAGGPPAFTA
jgi:hypothetical protein